MLALILCIAALAACFFAGRRSLVLGIAAVAATGYLYGIIRANIPQTASHFIFDAGVAGFYLAVWMRPLNAIQRHRIKTLLPWVVCLMAWPAILFFIPIQDPLVQLVGLRGQILFLPFLLIGAMMDGEEMYSLALWLAAFNLVAIGFAGAEWWLGVPQFYPLNAVTQIIYASNDAGAHHGIRIPATFVNSSTYAETMVLTFPLLVGAWMQNRGAVWQRRLIVAAIAGCALGAFMAASRTHDAILIVLVASLTFFGRLNSNTRFVWIVLVAIVGLLVATQPRLQRIATLNDESMVGHRFESSINENFLEFAHEHPLGNGLGGGGTSLPYFLAGRVRNPIVMENEYARIMLETGIPGLALWLAFLAWIVMRPIGRPFSDPWYVGRWLSRLACVAEFGAAVLGTGMLTSIPGTFLLLMLAGSVAARRPAIARQTISRRYGFPDASYVPIRRYGW
jgi:hypothetical protein